MRDFLNSILSFIGASSLTDEEFEAITADSPTYDQASYDALSGVLEAREAISTLQSRLVSYYTAKGVDVSPQATGKSNIFLGAVL